jgi:hypothetical protein
MGILLALLHSTVSATVITESTYEGRAQFVVKTASAEYWLDKTSGGLSRLLDRDGLDWISFKKEPLSKFPESAAAGYRGIPNAVFGKDNPDAGAGHPGFDLCESALVSSNVIRTVSRFGRWSWTWAFSETTARLRFEKVDAERGHWFLYEGTPGGRYSPTNQFWGTDLGGPNFDAPAIKSQRFGRWRWAYFGDRLVPRVLAIAQAQPDEFDDTFWYLGSTNGGAADSPDGMVVFGFGRGAGTKALLRTPQEFVIGLIESVAPDALGHATVARLMARWIEPSPPARKPRLGELHFGPAQGSGLPLTGTRFAQEFLPAGTHLVEVAACLHADSSRLVRALRFVTRDEHGNSRTITIGEPRGEWSANHAVPEGARLVGISGAGGWFVDRVRFHFSDGSASPLFGGSGGDYAFRQFIPERGGHPAGECRGLWGTWHDGFLESLGLLTMPRE